MRPRKLPAILLALTLIITLEACGANNHPAVVFPSGGQTQTEEASVSPTTPEVTGGEGEFVTPNGAETPKSPADSAIITPDRAAMFAAYAAILEREHGAMTLPEDLSAFERPDWAAALDIGAAGKIEVRDVTGDGLPELIYLTHVGGCEEWLNVRTWRGGEAVKVFGQRVRSLADGGNYSAFVTESGELWLYSSERGASFGYGFWNVSEYIMGSDCYETEPHSFVGDRDQAEFYCSIRMSGPDRPAACHINGKEAFATEAAAWLEDWVIRLDAVLMDSENSQYTHADGEIEDIGLYSETLGPWAEYVMYPYDEQCMTWDFALTSLLGDREV